MPRPPLTHALIHALPRRSGARLSTRASVLRCIRQRLVRRASIVSGMPPHSHQAGLLLVDFRARNFAVVRRCPPRGYRHSCQTIDRHAAGRAANPVVLLAARVSLSQLRILAVDRGRQRASVRPNSWRLLSLVRLRWCVLRVLFIFEVTDSSLLVLKPTTRLLVRSGSAATPS